MVSPVNPPSYRSTSRFLAESLEGVTLLVLVMLGWPFARRWLANMGTMAGERVRAWPGDRFVSKPQTVCTRAVDIDAPPDAVWPWVVQFGLGRAGFYSYELFERIAMIPVRNVESIMPEMQSLAVGDEILLHPKAPGIPVADVVPNERLCFAVSDELADRFERTDPARSWSIYLEPKGAAGTRLLLRGCIEPLQRRTVKARLGLALGEPIDFLMEQRMLRSLRRLAERHAPPAPPANAS